MLQNKKRKSEKLAGSDVNNKKLKYDEERSSKIHGIKIERLDSPEKHRNDVKHYRLIQLQNGLKALLISDSERDENDNIIDASNVNGTVVCSLSVSVGSYSDSRNAQGLAHLFGIFSFFKHIKIALKLNSLRSLNFLPFHNYASTFSFRAHCLYGYKKISN